MFLDSYPIYTQEGWEKVPNDSRFLEFSLLFGFLAFVFEFYLDFRQLSKFRNVKQIPSELKGYDLITPEKFEQSSAYGADKLSFGLVQSTFLCIEGLAMIILGYLPLAWDYGNKAALYISLYDEATSSPLRKEIMITFCFVCIISLHDLIVGLPFSLYSTFVVEERHGFNKMSLGLFISDKFKVILLMMVIGFPVLAAVISVIRYAGEYFYFYVWALLFGVSVMLLTIYPVYIAPLFNKYTKLDSGEVYDAVKELAQRVEFPLTQIYSVDGSKRSAHSNAYFYGFFKNKRIVLYDTLMSQVNIEELKAILGHEMGHWKLWHTLQGFAISQSYTLALFLTFSYVTNLGAMYRAFGFAFNDSNTGNGMPIFVGLLLFTQTIWAPIDKLLTFLVNCNSRINEFGADKFSNELGFGSELCSGLVKISVENLGCLVPDPWYSAYHYSHPPLIERIRAIKGDAGADKGTKSAAKKSKK